MAQATYFLAATLCYWASCSGAADRSRTDQWFWLSLMILLAVLGTARAVDFQLLLVDFLRRWITAFSLYEDRRIYQAAALLGCAAAGLLIVAKLSYQEQPCFHSGRRGLYRVPASPHYQPRDELPRAGLDPG